MGSSDSRPAYNYEGALLAPLAAGQLPQSIEVDDPAGQPANCSKPRRLKGLEAGLVSIPYASQNHTRNTAGTRRGRATVADTGQDWPQ